MALTTLQPGEPAFHPDSRLAIDGAIGDGRLGINKPARSNHWLMPYWEIGQRLAQLAKTIVPPLQVPYQRRRASDFDDSRPTEPSHGRRASDGAAFAIADAAKQLLQKWDGSAVVGPALAEETLAFLRLLASAGAPLAADNTAVMWNG